jgi:hypothetical protein
MNTSPRPAESTRITFWLVPAISDRLDLEEIINRLADKYNAPSFMPHITLWSTQLTRDESPQQILETATRGFARFTLQATSLDHGPDRFKSIFIRFNSAPLILLSNALGSSCRTPGRYHLDAHLSLLYRQLSPAERKKIVCDLQTPQSCFHFDTVIATAPGPGKTSFEKVNLWQHVAEIRL